MQTEVTSTSFSSWIPTYDNVIPFERCGTGSISPSRTANVADGQHRYLIGYQKRVIRDSPLPDFISRLFGLSSNFRFVCIACAAEDLEGGDLVGTLGMYSALRGVSDWPRVGKLLDRIQTELKYKKAPSECYINLELGGALWLEIFRSAIFLATFRLSRSGTIRIEPESANLRVTSDVNLEIDPLMHHAICSQLFYFMCDFCLTGLGAPSREDPMYDIYRSDPEDLWIISVARTLKQRAIDLAAMPDLEDLYRAEHSLTLLSAFLASHDAQQDRLGRYGLTSEALERIQRFITVKIESVKHAKEVAERTPGRVFSFFTSSLGLLISFVGLASLVPDQFRAPLPSGVISSINALLNHPDLAATLLLSIAMGFTIFVREAKSSKIERAIFRILLAFPRSVAITIMLVIAIVSFALAFHFLKLS